jgi:hypothetical protein
MNSSTGPGITGDKLDNLRTLLNNLIEEGDTLKVREQDLTRPPIHVYLQTNEKDNIKLTSEMAFNTAILNVSTGHGITTDHHLFIAEGNFYIQSKVKAVVGNTITISTPTANIFTTDATITRGKINMAVDGSSNNVTFTSLIEKLKDTLDIQYVKIRMTHTSAGDDSKFGDQSALTNGVLFRHDNSLIFNLGNYQSNGEFHDFGGEVNYDDKAGGGKHSTKIDFDIKKIYGVVFRMVPVTVDRFFAIVRDKLDTSIATFYVSLMGQLTLGE